MFCIIGAIVVTCQVGAITVPGALSYASQPDIDYTWYYVAELRPPLLDRAVRVNPVPYRSVQYVPVSYSQSLVPAVFGATAVSVSAPGRGR